MGWEQLRGRLFRILGLRSAGRLLALHRRRGLAARNLGRFPENYVRSGALSLCFERLTLNRCRRTSISLLQGMRDFVRQQLLAIFTGCEIDVPPMRVGIRPQIFGRAL